MGLELILLSLVITSIILIILVMLLYLDKIIDEEQEVNELEKTK